MKKFLIAACMAMLLLLGACQQQTTVATTTQAPTTTAQKPSAPTGLSIERGVVTFDENGADSYSIRIKQDGVLIMNMSVQNGDSIKSVLENGEYTAMIKAIKGNASSDFSEEITFTIGSGGTAITDLNELKLDDLIVDSYINYSGRTYYDESQGRMYFYYTASGFKVSFTGTTLKAEFYAGNSSKLNSEARLVVLVDGEVYPDGGTTIVLNKGQEAEYVLVEGLENTKHTVEVLKRSEASDNLTALKKLSTDGNFETPEADREKKILVLGASGSCGYGNLAKDTSVTKNTYNSDGLRAFSYLTARMYDTDVDMINASGWGAKWGWNSSSGNENIPTAFTRVGINQSNQMVGETYDYTQDSYDLIIINLGMNDFNTFIKNNPSKRDFYIDQYKKAVKELYLMLIDAYDCPIVIVHTSNTNTSAEGIYNEEVAKEVNETMKKDYVFPIVIPANGSGTNYGANSHANVQTHIWTADLTAEWIEANLGWTKVRENLTFTPSRDQVA